MTATQIQRRSGMSGRRHLATLSVVVTIAFVAGIGCTSSDDGPSDTAEPATAPDTSTEDPAETPEAAETDDAVEEDPEPESQQTPEEEPESTQAPPASSGDERLDALYAACDDGDMHACDDLYREAPLGSDHEHFGDTCGGRNEPAGWCAETDDFDFDLDLEADDLMTPELFALFIENEFAAMSSSELADVCMGVDLMGEEIMIEFFREGFEQDGSLTWSDAYGDAFIDVLSDVCS
jgi:hypothetical protein